MRELYEKIRNRHGKFKIWTKFNLEYTGGSISAGGWILGVFLKTIRQFLTVTMIAAGLGTAACHVAAADEINAEEGQFWDWQRTRGDDDFHYSYMQLSFLRLDPFTEGFKAKDIETALKADIAQVRAHAVYEFLVSDLNDDGQVTAQELDKRIGADADANEDPKKDRRNFAAADTSGDGIVTFNEGLAFADLNARLQRSDFRDQIDKYELVLSIDPTPDGEITQADIEKLKQAVFAPYYLDKIDIPACLESDAIAPECSILTWMEE